MNTDNIWTDPTRMGGKPCIRNSRFTVAQLIAELADGSTIYEIVRDYNLDLKTTENALHEIANLYDPNQQ